MFIETNVLHPVLSQKDEALHIYLKQMAIWLTPTIYDRQNASSQLKPTVKLSSSISFIQILFSLPYFLSISNYDDYNDHLLSSAHDHTNAHCLPQPIDPLLQSMSLAHSLSLSCTPHIALTTDLWISKKFHLAFFNHNASLPYIIVGVT